MNVPAGDSLVSLLFHGIEQTLMTVCDESSSSSKYSKNGLIVTKWRALGSARFCYIQYELVDGMTSRRLTSTCVLFFFFGERVYVL